MINLKDVLSTLAQDNLCGEPFAYSGRGMYGRQCLAVELDVSNGHANLCQLGAAMALYVDHDDIDRLVNIMGDTTTDALGRSTVVYWPRTAF